MNLATKGGFAWGEMPEFHDAVGWPFGKLFVRGGEISLTADAPWKKHSVSLMVGEIEEIRVKKFLFVVGIEIVHVNDCIDPYIGFSVLANRVVVDDIVSWHASARKALDHEL